MDTISAVLKVIIELEKYHNSSVDVSEINLVAIGLGIFPEETRIAIKKLRDDGAIYDPNGDKKYKVV